MNITDFRKAKRLLTPYFYSPKAIVDTELEELQMEVDFGTGVKHTFETFEEVENWMDDKGL